MNRFFKYLLAVVVGSMASAFFFLMGIVMLVALIVASSSKEVKVDDNTILHLNLKGPIVERTTDDPLSGLSEALTGREMPLGLNQILKSIENAKRDSRIEGIYLNCGMVMAGLGTLEEIRTALEDFKESGKFIYSYGSVYSQRGYYLASVADSVFLTPAGMLEFKGLNSSHLFFKNALAKLGVEMQVFKYGEFKSAVEPFILERMSDEARLQTETYLTSMWQHMLKQIADSRSISMKSLEATAELFPTFREPELLVESGLIDGFKYQDEIIDLLKKRVGIEDHENLKTISPSTYADVYIPGKRKGLERNKIAVIYATGEIDGGSSSGIDSEKLSRAIRQVRRDTTIKAVVLRINSPGGSGLGSEIIWREVELTKQVKPIVASMGDLAASGGYYIAAPANAIVAHPTTLTGSIGVFGLIPNTENLLNKIGITTDRVKTNTFADMPSLDRPFTRDEKALMQNYVTQFYHVFLQRCADGRNTTTDAIDKIGQGRVWSGENALEINLVDKLGGLSDAIALAAKKADIESYRIVEYPEMLSPFEQLMKKMSGDAQAKFTQRLLGERYQLFETLYHLQNAYPIQTRIPYDINIY